MEDIEAKLRASAVYFVKGKWPEIIQHELPKTLIHGKTYIVAIMEAE